MAYAETVQPDSHDLVVISLEVWDDVWRRNQHLVAGLLRRDPSLRVLFVEPPVDRLHDLVARRGWTHGRGARTAEGFDGRLHLFEPTKTMPRFAGRMADASWRRQVEGAIERLGMHAPIVWVNDLQGAELVRTGRYLSLYDITDDWLAADRPRRVRQRLQRNEDVLFAECCEIVVCSPGLEASRGALRPVQLVPNAVDVARYRHPYARPDDLPANAALYVGTLHEDRLNIELVADTARRLGDGASVVLLGPDALAARSRDRLREAGVMFLGPRSHEQVPAYLQHADALIVPHLVNEFTESLDPLKLYEYRAAGRPIVSTPVAGFREAAGEGATVVSLDAFAGAVAACLADTAPIVGGDDVPDWSERVSQMEAVIDRVRAIGQAEQD